METTNTTQEIAVLLDLTQTEKDLIEAEGKHANVVYDVTVAKQMKAAKEAQKELRGMRTTVEKKRLEAGRVLLDMKKTNDEKAKGLIERISRLEDPIGAQIVAEESRIEAERIAKAQAEQARIDGHRAYIAELRAFPATLHGKPASVIEARIKDWSNGLGVIDCEEFNQEKDDAEKAALFSANEVLAQARARESEQARLAELEAQAEAQRKRQEELERKLREAEEREAQRVREEQERAEAAERERQEAEERRVNDIRGRIDGLGSMVARSLDRLSSEELTVLCDMVRRSDPSERHDQFGEFFNEAMNAWRDAMQMANSGLEQARQREAGEAAERERMEAIRAEQEAEAERQRVERERLERERAEHEAQVEADRLKNLTLVDAAKHAVRWFHDHGHKDIKVCTDLEHAIRGSEQA